MKKQFGTVLFSNLTTFPLFNGKPTDKYEITITLDDTQAADAEVNGLVTRADEYQGNTQTKAKFKTKFKLKNSNLVDRLRKAFVDDMGNLREIPRGSKVAVFYTQRDLDMPSGKITTNDLQGIQVVEEMTGVEFDTYEDEGMDMFSEDSGTSDVPF